MEWPIANVAIMENGRGRLLENTVVKWSGLIACLESRVRGKPNPQLHRQHECRALLKAAGPGGGMLETISYRRVDDETHPWEVQIHQLILAADGTKVPTQPHPMAMAKPRYDIVIPKPSRCFVVSAVARALRYPDGLIAPQVPIKDIVDYLDAPKAASSLPATAVSVLGSPERGSMREQSEKSRSRTPFDTLLAAGQICKRCGHSVDRHMTPQPGCRRRRGRSRANQRDRRLNELSAPCSVQEDTDGDEVLDVNVVRVSWRRWFIGGRDVHGRRLTLFVSRPRKGPYARTRDASHWLLDGLLGEGENFLQPRAVHLDDLRCASHPAATDRRSRLAAPATSMKPDWRRISSGHQ